MVAKKRLRDSSWTLEDDHRQEAHNQVIDDILVELDEMLDMNEEKFYRLKKEHGDETFVLSFHKQTPAYQAIIDAHEKSVKFIMEDWKKSGDKETFHWFHALHEIVTDNPVPYVDRGKIVKMKNLWLEWYDKQV